MNGGAGKRGLELLAAGVYRCPDPQATFDLGSRLGELLEAGDVVVLSGDLGAGKTKLVGGVCDSLGDDVPVTSPTFSIMCVHDGGRLPLYHFDLYRLKDASELEDTGIFEVLDSDGACCIEWGEAYADELGDDLLTLRLSREGSCDDGEAARRAEVSASGSRSRRLADDLDESVRRFLNEE